MTLAGDENAANDTSVWPITITPITDVGVREFTVPQYVVTGTERVVALQAFTGSNPVPGVLAHGSQRGTGRADPSLTTSAGTCAREDIHRFTCALGDLPASSSVTLQARVAAATPIGHSSFDFSVAAPGDNNTNNNQRSASFHTVDGGDLRVSVAATSVTATTNEIFAFPSITIRHTGPIVDGRLEVTLPTGTTVRSISGSPASCSGTSSTTLLCSLSSWPEDQALQIDLGLSVGAGSGSTFTSMVRVRSGNDTESVQRRGQRHDDGERGHLCAARGDAAGQPAVHRWRRQLGRWWWRPHRMAAAHVVRCHGSETCGEGSPRHLKAAAAVGDAWSCWSCAAACKCRPSGKYRTAPYADDQNFTFTRAYQKPPLAPNGPPLLG